MMRLAILALLFFASVPTVLGQAPHANRAVAGRAAAPVAQSAGQTSAAASGVDAIIALVKANMSEGLVLKIIQRQNKTYDLTPEDLVKLQKAGVSETIINAMLDPSSVSAARPTTPAPAPAGRPAAAPVAPVAPAAPRGASTQTAFAASPSMSASGSTASAEGCDPQASSAAAAANQDKRPRGMFSSFKDKMKESAQAAVDGAGNIVNCAANKVAQGSQSEVRSAMDDAIGTPGKKVAEVDASINKTTDANHANPNANASSTIPAVKVAAAPAAGKRGSAK